jgi:hypothetical protein
MQSEQKYNYATFLPLYHVGNYVRNGILHNSKEEKFSNINILNVQILFFYL